MTESLLSGATLLRAAGIATIPIKTDGSKAPSVNSWKQFETRLPTIAELQKWFGSGTRQGIALIGGKVSGNLEILDFDAPELIQEWRDLVEKTLPGLLDRLPQVETPAKGLHVFFRCSTIEGNRKLAEREVEVPEGTKGARERDGRWFKIETTIETRGEGGYVITAGSPAACHPSGRLYQLTNGDLKTISTITEREREILFACARSFNEYVKPSSQVAPERALKPASGLKPGEDFNQRGDVRALLERHGWKYLRPGPQGELWQRPGGDHQSATLFRNGNFFVFSSNAGPAFEPGCSYSPFALLAQLEHAGDFQAAAAALSSQGYGERLRTEKSPSENKQPVESDQLLPVVRMADVKTQKVDWLWPNRIASHSLTIMEGIEGVGKSTLLCAIAAGVTLGQGLPESESSTPGNVVWLSAEDDLARVLKPRLESAGVNCERVFAVGEPFSLNERGLLGLRAAIAQHQPKLVIIDPIFAFTLGDANKGNDSRSLTGELKKIAEQFACAICLVRHVGKSKGLGDPRAAGLYSIEWRAAARSVLLIGADPDQPQKRAITQTKNNLGPPAASLGYLIQSDPDSPSGARFFWTGQSDLTAERILSQVRNEDDEEAVGRREATDFLRDALSDGARPAKDIQTEARQCGISDRTLNRAKAALGIQSKKQGGTFSGRQNWVWELPPEDCQTTSEGCQTFEAGNLQLNGSQKTTYASETAEGCQLPISGNLQGNVGNLQADQEVF